MPLPNLGNQNNQGGLPPIPKGGTGLPPMGTLPPPSTFTTSTIDDEPSDDVFSQISPELPTEEPALEESISYEEEREIPTIEQTRGLPSEDETFIDPNEKETEYIDYEKEKIQPIGGKKAKIKDKDLDARKNKLFGLKLARLFIYLAIVGVFALGVKNTWFPTQVYTNEEIEWLALSAIGDTGFPLVEGRSYATAYMYHYLSTKEDSSLLLSQISDLDNRVIPTPNSKQKKEGVRWEQRPVTAPILVSERAIDYNTAIYTFKALITDSDISVMRVNGGNMTFTGHWASFVIQVYYNQDEQTFSILTPPTVVKIDRIKNLDEDLKALPLGIGEEDRESAPFMDSAIKGFIKAYLRSTAESHAEIDQYIPATQPPNLINGFGGAYKLANGDNDIKYTVWKTRDPNIWKVELWLNLTDSTVTPTESGVTYTNQHYVITMEKTDKDVYLVTKFAPYKFILDN